MNIVKHKHACLEIRVAASRLIIDPGVWTSPLESYSSVTALVITHVHPDHCDPEKVKALVQANPELKFFSTKQVAEKLADIAQVTVPKIDQNYEIGDLKLQFYGGLHAKIMEAYPQDQNYGVLVNGTVYYPGDSFTPCPDPHRITAVPVIAPWLKFSEVADFVQQDTADQIFPTHNNIANENGHELLERMLDMVRQNKTLHNLQPEESIEL